MKNPHCWWWLGLGLTLGVFAMSQRAPTRQALAGNDRHEDYIMCTGQVQVGPNVYADTVWMLDYRAGKLLGTIVDRSVGKILPWKEVDLVQEFKIAPKQNVHFMMTTSNAVTSQFNPGVAQVNIPQLKGNMPGPPGAQIPGGQMPVAPVFVQGNLGSVLGALYVAETETGRFAVYTIGLHVDPRVGPTVAILRHDATQFRRPPGDQ